MGTPGRRSRRETRAGVNVGVNELLDRGVRARSERVSTSWRATLGLALLVVVAPTVVIWIVSSKLGLLVPKINLDVAVVYLLTVLLGRYSARLACFVAVFGTAMVLIVQVLVGVGLIYLDDPALIREYLSFVQFWPWRLIGIGAAIGAVALTILYLLLRRVRAGEARALPMIAVLALVAAADLASRTELGYKIFGSNVATSSVVRATKIARTWATSPGFTVGVHPGGSAAETLAAMTAKPARILSVSVESMGMAAKDPAYNAAMFRPLTERLGGLYKVDVGSHPYKGATLAGEIRELCALRIAGTPTGARAREISPKCLPRTLAAEGYYTAGLHGNSRFFYNRSELYRAIGFVQSVFYEDLRPKGAEICRTRAFAGICDREMLKTALDIGGAHPKSFVHLMTLDTHFPVGSTSPEDEACGPGASPKASGLCLYRNLMARALDNVATAVCEARVKPDMIYVFGDHAPPFAVGAERNFFDRSRIPVIVLTLRDAGALCRK